VANFALQPVQHQKNRPFDTCWIGTLVYRRTGPNIVTNIKFLTLARNLTPPTLTTASYFSNQGILIPLTLLRTLQVKREREREREERERHLRETEKIW